VNVSGVAAVWLISVALVVWIVDLVRKDRLYVGYGVIFVGAIAAGLAAISLPRALGAVSGLWIGVMPASGFVELVLLFFLVMMIYGFSQLTRFSNRLTALIQEIAIREATTPRDPPSHAGR
jgi:hypothetical protein